MKRNAFSVQSVLLLALVFFLSACYSPRVAPGENTPRAEHNPNVVERTGEIDNATVTLLDMLRRVPGVIVSGDNSITIRGITSLNLSNEPLFVVDGSPVGMGYKSVSGLNPNFVSRIRVLKGHDASIYGARAANGVIEIDTKN